MGTVVLLAIAAALMAAKKSSISGMQDAPVTLENIRRGVKNGWYTAVLTKVDGQYAVRLSGKTQDGNTYTDVYPVSKENYYTLLNDGLDEV